MENNPTNFITCVKWVKKGVCKPVPKKVQIDQEELRQAMLKAKINIDCELQDLEAKPAASQDEEDIMAKYDLDNYDDEDDDVCGGGGPLEQLSKLTCYATNQDDPYITIPEDDDSDSDQDDYQIKPTDNLILVGHIEGDCSTMQVYVYNSEEGHLFVHHEILLPTVPLALEWLDFNPSQEQPANLVAIASNSPVVEVWDLDTVDDLKPLFKLGNKKKKKKVGHTDAVLDVSANRIIKHALATGSADHTVILWDLQTSLPTSTIGGHEGNIQCLEWHPEQQHLLLTGCCDGKARLIDCREEKLEKTFSLEGEVEKVLWNHRDSNYFWVSTDGGDVKYYDIRHKKSLWTLKAHFKPCTCVSLSYTDPSLLLTGSFDNTVKLWDVSDSRPSLVLEKDWKLGHVLAAEFSFDSPFVFCAAGDKKKENFKVWDIRNNKAVRSRLRIEGGDEEEHMSE